MQINSNISFKSRNSFIKDADKLRRTVNREFPVVAVTKAAHEALDEVSSIKRFRDFITRKVNIIKDYREDRRYVKNPFTFYKNILYSTSKEKLGMCYEQSSLIELALRMNGINNCSKASLVDASGNLLNHSVVCIRTSNNPKKTVVIDPWLQDCGYLPEMITKYKNEYSRYFAKNKTCSDIYLKQRKPQELTPEQIDYFKEKYPNLVLKQKLFMQG